ncbi:MAG: HAD-IB family phosphatase [Candidatus Peribacteraceae bacterium]|jgi:D-3-phosphoglycerate dehydrogenase
MTTIPPSPRYSFLFDFDSTLVGAESLDMLIGISLREHYEPEKVESILQEIAAITDAGMEGHIDLQTSITERLKKARIHRKHFAIAEPLLLESVTHGIAESIDLMHQNGCPVSIISGALMECVLPVAQVLHIPPSSIHANEGIYDANGYLSGIAAGPLAQSDGKVHCIASLKKEGQLPGTVVMIGDGISDLLPYRSGVVDTFIGAGFHRERAAVRSEAPHYCSSVLELHSLISSLLSS